MAKGEEELEELQNRKNILETQLATSKTQNELLMQNSAQLTETLRGLQNKVDKRNKKIELKETKIKDLKANHDLEVQRMKQEYEKMEAEQKNPSREGRKS
jgi:flagellar motility protein MotE (MotC chaperone)